MEELSELREFIRKTLLETYRNEEVLIDKDSIEEEIADQDEKEATTIQDGETTKFDFPALKEMKAW
jgi:hypothetical protein